MPLLSVAVITAYTATLMIHADTARFHLSEPVTWSLNNGDQSGISDCVPVFLDDLLPDTRYTFSAAGQQVSFKTAQCAGCIDVKDWGVSADATDNTMAFSQAIAAVPKGGTLRVPCGCYVTGPLFVKSDMTLLLSEGAEILAPASRHGWPILPALDNNNRVVGTWEGLPEASYASLVTAIACERLSITGRGTIDGGGDRGDWWTWPKETRDGARRPRTVFMAHCRHISLSGFTVRNSPAWTVHPFHCHDVTAAALTIENPADSPNTDGLNPESSTDVNLLGLQISVGDDCIAVKSGKRGTGEDRRVSHIAPTRYLSICNCLMRDGHGAVVMGSEMSGDITDVSIRRCEFISTDRGLRIKTRRGRGGQVARVSLQDVSMTGVGTAVAINAFYFCDADGKSSTVQSRKPAPVDATTPRINAITIQNVELIDVRHAAAALLGLPEAPLQDIKLADITISYDPDAESGEALMACHIPQMRHGGIVHEFADITVDDALTSALQGLSHVV